MSSNDPSPRKLEIALFDLGQELAYPPVPAVASSVRQALETGLMVPKKGLARRFAFAAAVVLALFAGVMTFSPAAREAVADFLGVGGIRIISPDRQPSELPPPSEDLDLGRRVADLAAAEQLVDFEVVAPSLEGLETPDGVFVSSLPPTEAGRVSLAYAPRSGLPRAPETDLGLLITEFEAGIEETYVKKLIATGVRVRRVVVDGNEGFWIAGGPHLLTFVDDEGRVVSEATRLAGNTLIWEREGLTLRLESALSLAEALEIAGSIE